MQAKVGGDDRDFGRALKTFGTADGSRREDRFAALARAKGEADPHPVRFLPANDPSFLPTSIPVFECIEVTAAGQVTSGVYSIAGPNGIDLASMTAEDRRMYLQANEGKTKLLNTAPWGTFIGQTCRDPGGQRCGEMFVIGEHAFLSPEKVGAGYLWVIVNGHVSLTGEGWLAGKPQLHMSAYNSHKGGFQFDVKLAPPERCTR